MLGVVNYAWGWKWAYIASVSTTEVQFKRACKGYFILCHLKKKLQKQADLAWNIF